MTVSQLLDKADALISILDARDGDPDLEPSLADTAAREASQADLEGEHDGLEPDEEEQ